jgi:hypothetical protein
MRPTPIALGILFATGLLLAIPGDPRAQEAGSSTGEITEPVQRGIERGLEYLVGLQDPSGAFGSKYKVASTSLACLAIMANGTVNNRGPYGQALERGLGYILSDQVARPVPRGGVFLNDGEVAGRMHSHGLATLFLAEIYGMIPRYWNPETHAKVERTLRGAVELSIKSQTEDGGWGYYHHGDPDFGSDESSVTITQLQALRAARNAGLAVPAASISRAIKYVRRCANLDGSFKYSLKMKINRPSYELTAAAVSTLNASGVYHSAELERGLTHMRRTFREYKNPALAASNYYYYGNFYAAQAMFQAGGKDWSFWFSRAKEDYLRKQRKYGNHWDSPRGFGQAYATAMALLVLQIPYRYLPIFQR